MRAIPRAPGRLPLVGHAIPLLHRPLDFVQSLPSTGDLVRVDLGTLPVYFVTNADLTHDLLVTKSRHMEKGRFFTRARILIGDSLPTAPAHIHRPHRRLMQPAFHRERIAEYARVMADRARAMADAWTPGRSIPLDEELARFSVSTLAATMFSTDISRPAVEAVLRDVPVLLKTAMFRTVTPKLLDRLPIPANRKFDQAAVRLRKVIDDVIAAYREHDDSEVNDLLSLLLAARDSDTGEALTDREVRDELVAILFAGTETTASTLSWTFHELAAHPEVEHRLLDEIRSVVGDRPISFEDVPKLKYTDRVVREVSRMHSVPLLMRRVATPVELGGTELPVGTEIAFSLYALHRDPRLYEAPERFDPDRWLPERSQDRPRESYIPFGSGNRKCIGDGFAWTEIVITLATVLARWRLEPLPGHSVREVASAVAHPDRLPMRPVPRTAAA
ncbi:cytochrome P450 [Streptomyces smyrnaeus]|uniref:Cytochrome P450 n=1 Tax=Streptomyces smyrnaeus TaxID=1387713 RepID=A0ABS3XSG4_9ACTN|nr:cytochrome P450 [Streptomyces smyrnaeus]